MKNSALEATIQLKQAVMNEHESNQILNNQAIKLQVTTVSTVVPFRVFASRNRVFVVKSSVHHSQGNIKA